MPEKYGTICRFTHEGKGSRWTYGVKLRENGFCDNLGSPTNLQAADFYDPQSEEDCFKTRENGSCPRGFAKTGPADTSIIVWVS